jgi:hypothetical protein
VTHVVATVLLALVSSLTLQGCTTINVVPQEGVASTEFRKSVHVGILTLRLPATEGNVQAVDVKTLGAGWQSGPFLGWNASNVVTANPADCQLLVVIRSDVEAENAAKILESLKGEKICVVDYSAG